MGGILNVQIIGPRLDVPGGVSNYYGLLLRRLRDRRDINIDYVEIGYDRDSYPFDFLRPLRDQWRVRARMRDFNPDIVHVNPSLVYRSFFRDSFFILGAKRRGYKVLVFFRGWSPMFANKIDQKWRKYFSNSYGKSDAFIILAKEFERQLREWGVRAPIFRSVTMIDDDSVDERRVIARLNKTRNRCASDPVRILFMSRLETVKGALETLKAVEKMRNSGQMVSLTVAGSGEAESDLKEYLKKRPEANEYVSLVGHVTGQEKIDILASHELFCFPTSFGEGMPTSVVEAMAFGMPVITRPVGGIADFFVPGKMGALLETRDVDAVTRALDSFVSDPVKMADVGGYNYLYAKENFYCSKIVQQLLDIYGLVNCKTSTQRIC